MKKIMHWIFILLIFIFVVLIGYFTFNFASNIDGKKAVDTSLQEKNLATSKDTNSDYDQDKTKVDPNGKLVKINMEGNIDVENGSWDFICKDAAKNQCGASVLIVTSSDDPDFKKSHPINEYIVITGEKKFKYKITTNTNNAKGLYLRKRMDN